MVLLQTSEAIGPESLMAVLKWLMIVLDGFVDLTLLSVLRLV